MTLRRWTAGAWLTAAVVLGAAGTAGALSDDAAPVPTAAEPTAAPTTGPTATSPALTPVERGELATVRLTDPCGADLTTCGWGSGSVVDSSGLILTNAHVAAPASPGLGGQYPDELAWDVTNPPYLVVSIPPSPEETAVPRYRASVVAVDGYADLAVVRIDADLEGNPLAAPPLLTSVQPGRLDGHKNDSDIRVIGYPESGGTGSPTVSPGTISSKPADPQGRATGPWELNTSAPIHGGNSGGLVIDDTGKLIAVPTYSRGWDDKTYRARAVELALPLIAAAKSGADYRSPFLVPATGDEELVGVSWSDEDQDGCLDADDPGTGVSATGVWAQPHLAGLAEGEEYRLVLTGPDGWRTSWQGVRTDRCPQLPLTPASDDLLVPEGTYTLEAFAGPAWISLGTATTEVVWPAYDEYDEPDASDQ